MLWIFLISVHLYIRDFVSALWIENIFSKSPPVHFAPFVQAAVISVLFESVVCADLIERNNRCFCITDNTCRRKASIYRAVHCNSYSLCGNMPPTSFLQSSASDTVSSLYPSFPSISIFSYSPFSESITIMADSPIWVPSR